MTSEDVTEGPESEVEWHIVPYPITLNESETLAVASRLARRNEPHELRGAPWFRLAEYGSIKAWTERDWYAALASRFAVMSRIKRASPDPSAFDVVRDHFEKMYVTPIAPGGFISTRNCRAYVHAGVQFFPPISMPSSISDPINPGNLADEHEILIIDTAASDSALKATFATWLKGLRRPSIWSQGFSKVDMKLWTAWRVIPFIDLELYELATGSRIKSRDKANALFRDRGDDDEGHTERMRKITAKHAKRLMSEGSLKAMAAQLGGKDFVAHHSKTKARRTGRTKIAGQGKQ